MIDVALHRNNDPDTSVLAANSVKVARLEEIVLGWLMDRGERGGTTEEIAVSLNLPRVTISPRLKPLEKKDLVTASEIRRKGSSGRTSIVWVAVNLKRKNDGIDSQKPLF
jgi:predicted ArsR family transcriptional regulator